MPRTGWLALGAILAALLLVDGPLTSTGSRGAIALGLVAAAGAMGGALLAVRVGRRDGVVAVLGIGVGVVLIVARVALSATGPATAPPIPEARGPWSASVVSVGPLRAGSRPAMLEIAAVPGLRVAATLPAWPVIVPGDRVRVEGAIERPPDGEYGAYLLKIGAAGTLRARAVEVEPPSGDLGRTLEGLRRGADEGLRVAIPEPEAGLASGILIGLRDRVDRDLGAAFTTVGASHVVAISGWNIAIVATTLGALTGRVARRRRAALTALAIVAYVVFVGSSPSVVRAAVMAAVVLFAREVGRPSRAAAAIAWAVTLLLILDPTLIGDIGFRLSALATAGLIVWGTPLTDRLSGAAPGRVRAWLAESLGVSFAAQLATLPVVALEFGRLSLVAPIINLGVVPLVAPAMAAGAVALVAGVATFAGVPAVIATIGGLPAWALLAAIVNLVRAGASIPFASLDLSAPWDLVVAGIACLVIVVLDRWIRRRPTTPGVAALQVTPPPRPGSRSPSADRRPTLPRIPRLAALGLAAALVALTVAVVHRPTGVASLTVLDIGQGDAILLEGARGDRLLIDGGPDPGRLLVALDEQLPPWDRRIDLVVLSHPHEDHAAGLAALLDRYRVRTVFEPGMIGPGPAYAALNAALAAGGIDRRTLATGDRLVLDDIRLEVLWPDPGTVPQEPPDGGTEINNVSIVFLGEVGQHRFLLTGDMEEEIDPTLVARGLPPVEVLKVAHHGSRTASTGPFLETVRPTVAIVSSGRGNPYGHPAPATIARLEGIGARVYRTDTNGTVEVDLGPGPLRVRASRPVAGGPSGPAAATAVATPGIAASGFLCGTGPPPAAGAPRVTAPPPIGWTAGAGTAGSLRYHASDDDRHGCPRTAPVRLGRRCLRAGRRGGGAPGGSRPLPVGRAGALAGPWRCRRRGAHRGRDPGAARDRDHVRLGDARRPHERDPARPTRH